VIKLKILIYVSICKYLKIILTSWNWYNDLWFGGLNSTQYYKCQLNFWLLFCRFSLRCKTFFLQEEVKIILRYLQIECYNLGTKCRDLVWTGYLHILAIKQVMQFITNKLSSSQNNLIQWPKNKFSLPVVITHLCT
jgi:hypothetical protein